MERTKWVDRKFTFDFPEGWIFNILERLHGTAPRLHHMLAGLSEEKAGIRYHQKWSIKEHIGHLYDLDLLHDGRLDDFLEGKAVLRAADMSNALTNQSNHNEKSLSGLLRLFADRRKAFVRKLDTLDHATQMRLSLHPRLQVMMRPVDVAYFAAEHDDHHLASIRALMVQS